MITALHSFLEHRDGLKKWVSVLLDQLTCHPIRIIPQTPGEGLHLRGSNSGSSFGTAGSIQMSGTKCCRRQDLLGPVATQQTIPRRHFPPGQRRSSSEAKWGPGRSTHSLVRSRLLWSVEEAISQSLLPEEGYVQGLWDATQAAGRCGCLQFTGCMYHIPRSKWGILWSHL